MDVIANIDKYKRSFSRLSKNPENMFLNYLKNNNLTKTDFLYQIGLNKELINEHNFSEINDLISKVLTDEQFPKIECFYNPETGEKDNLKIYNSELKRGLTLKDNSICFILDNKENKNYSNHISYICIKNIVRRIETEIENTESNLGIENNILSIFAKETNYNNNGEVLDENFYKAKIKGKIGMIAHTLLFRDFQKESIQHGLVTLTELIKQNKINKDNVELSVNDKDLLKK